MIYCYMERDIISRKSGELLVKCVDENTENCLGSIDEFIELCEKTIEVAVPAEKYGLATFCEREIKYWHYRKSQITGKNEYQMSSCFVAKKV